MLLHSLEDILIIKIFRFKLSLLILNMLQKLKVDFSILTKSLESKQSEQLGAKFILAEEIDIILTELPQACR